MRGRISNSDHQFCTLTSDNLGKFCHRGNSYMWICIQNECESEDYTQILWEGVQLGEPISGQIIWLAEPTIKATAQILSSYKS